MPGTTPIYSLPYPVSSDLVSAYPALGQDLAEDLDDILAAKLDSAVPNGSESAPSIAHAGDTNTGIYFPAADEIGFTTNGTLRLKIDANGLASASTGTSFGAWTSYTPTVGQNSTPITKTVSYAKYVQIGKLVVVQVAVSFTASGTTNTPVYATLPVTAASSVQYAPNGSFLYEDAGTAFYAGTSTASASTTTVYFYVHNSGNYLGAVPNFAVANGDKLSFSLMYEAA